MFMNLEKKLLNLYCIEAGATVFDLGANVTPDEVVDTVVETGSSFILMSTYNGIALTYGKTLLEGFEGKRAG
jgi:methylmalonyl-CoA mutase cobalamin-binding subunit